MAVATMSSNYLKQLDGIFAGRFTAKSAILVV